MPTIARVTEKRDHGKTEACVCNLEELLLPGKFYEISQFLKRDQNLSAILPIDESDENTKIHPVLLTCNRRERIIWINETNIGRKIYL